MNQTIHPFFYKRAALLLAMLSLLVLAPLCLSSGAVAAEPARTLLPGGMPFGLRFSLAGVPVESVTGVITADGEKFPARDAGLQPGDLLLEIDGTPVTTAGEVCEAVTKSGGKPLTLKVSRPGEEAPFVLLLLPVASLPNGVYRAGIWVRDSTAGIGTVTVIDPQTGAFAGLGHGVCRESDGELLPLLQGSVFRVRVQGIRKGKEGAPGQLRGVLTGDAVGTLLSNSRCGVCGIFFENALPDWTGEGEPLPVAGRMSELHRGKATILCTLGESGVSEYGIAIEKLLGEGENGKNFLLRVTDPALLAETGGIVQGMSGSPILQDGKIVGAVTHVMVDDPTCGYGIFIGNMLRELPAA